MAKGNFIFGFACGILVTVAAALFITGYGDFSQTQRDAVRNTLAALDSNQNITPGFNHPMGMPEVEMLYRYESGDAIFTTTHGALV